VNGALRLLDGTAEASGAIAFAQSAKGIFRTVDAQWDMSIVPGGDGGSFALLNAAEYGKTGPAPTDVKWEEPRLRNSFAVGFDIYNPPTQDPFNADGNIENRAQRDVALFWNGVEIVKKLSPIEFRTGKLVPMRVKLTAVCGGAEASVYIGGTPVFDRFFIAGLTPYESRVAFGGRSGKITTTLDLDNVRVDYAGHISPPPAPTVVKAIDGQIIDIKNNAQSASVDMPANTDEFGRIICTLTLAEPPGGYDPWDRSAAIYVYDDKGERFEIVRYITPYRRGYTWNVDVTDYRSLLRGKKKLEVWCVTYGTGWKVSVDLSYYPGKPDRLAYMVRNLWVGSPEIGNPDKPVDAFFKPIDIVADSAARAAKLRFMVTGHGMSPNSENAAEFMPIKRTVQVNDASFENQLWKEDNYLNPLRPQGGTWKYDRAGWGPGDVVKPWDIDITPLARPGKKLAIQYRLAPYVNEGRGKTNPPFHWVESQIIYYK